MRLLLSLLLTSLRTYSYVSTNAIASSKIFVALVFFLVLPIATEIGLVASHICADASHIRMPVALAVPHLLFVSPTAFALSAVCATIDLAFTLHADFWAWFGSMWGRGKAKKSGDAAKAMPLAEREAIVGVPLAILGLVGVLLFTALALTGVLLACFGVPLAFLSWLVLTITLYALAAQLKLVLVCAGGMGRIRQAFFWWDDNQPGSLSTLSEDNAGLVAHRFAMSHLIECFCESIPQLILQAINNSLLDEWSTVAIVSTTVSGCMFATSAWNLFHYVRGHEEGDRIAFLYLRSVDIPNTESTAMLNSTACSATATGCGHGVTATANKRFRVVKQ